MRFVIDSNILISAIIRNSTTRKIVMESNFSFFYPKKSLEEIDKYKELIKEKSGLNDGEYQFLINGMLNKVNLADDDKIVKNIYEAKEIMENIDDKDVIFISLALYVKMLDRKPSLKRRGCILNILTSRISNS
ncbi:MAG: PIN domain-containing protein [Nanoarchaeota archaeon]